MKKTGSILKEKRDSVGLSISEVALATKINPKILAAIEHGDEANLPAKTFLKGFVRSYAMFLKMDVDEVLRSYQEEMGGPAERVHEAYKPETANAGSGRRRVADENSSGMRTVAVIAIVILIGMIIGVRELIEKYQREKVLESSEIKVSPLDRPTEGPQVNPTEETANSDASADAAEKTAEKDDAKAEAKPEAKTDPRPEVKADVKPDAKTEVKAPAKLEVKPEVKAETKAEVKSEVKAPAKPDVKAEAKPEEKPEPKPQAKPEVKVEAKAEVKPEPKPPKAIKSVIIFEALDKVEIKFQVKGQTKKIALAPTEVHTIHAEQQMTFEISDGGSVNIITDGRERGPPGELGKSKQVTLP